MINCLVNVNLDTQMKCAGISAKILIKFNIFEDALF